MNEFRREFKAIFIIVISHHEALTEKSVQRWPFICMWAQTSVRARPTKMLLSIQRCVSIILANNLWASALFLHFFTLLPCIISTTICTFPRPCLFRLFFLLQQSCAERCTILSVIRAVHCEKNGAPSTLSHRNALHTLRFCGIVSKSMNSLIKWIEVRSRLKEREYIRSMWKNVSRWKEWACMRNFVVVNGREKYDGGLDPHLRTRNGTAINWNNSLRSANRDGYTDIQRHTTYMETHTRMRLK